MLTLVLIISIMLPAAVSAQEDQGLQRAIEAVRSKFSIPDEYTEFNYNVYTEDGKNIWNLNWNSPKGLSGSMQVSIDDSGVVRSYYSYKPGDYETAGKFPGVTRQEAKAAAERFIEKVNPGLLAHLELAEDNQQTLMTYAHNFNYIRIVNGIPFYNNSVRVEVNKDTGEVRSYYYNWSESFRFPDAKDAITLDMAELAYIEKLGMKLVYNYRIEENDDYTVYPVYIPAYESNYYIDAFTGEKIKADYGYYDIYYGGAGRLASEKQMMDKGDVTLTPEELKAVDEVSKLLTKEQAESRARNTKLLEISKDYKLTYANLQRDWSYRNDFTWELSFMKEAADKGDYTKEHYASVRLNARTGEIRGFYRYIPQEINSEGKYNEKQAREKVDEFLRAIYAEKFGSLEFDDTYEGGYRPLAEGKNPANYNFRYLRMVNGIQFPANTVWVGFDAVNGKVVSLEMNWYDVEFPPIDDVLPAEDIYSNLFERVGLELQYKLRYPEEQTLKYDSERKPEVVLVYGLKPGKPVNLDAMTGQLLDYNGMPYKEAASVEYTDISGHYAEEQILALAQYGITIEGTEFKPDIEIAQKDFLALLAKTMNYGTFSPENSKELEQLYAYLIREGIVRKEEKNPDSSVTREDGIKFIIRALKYDKVADIRGIYSTGFKDEGSISSGLIGYVAIAKGLNIVSGSNGYFNPKGTLTRAQAAVIIYNYLNR
ncbi:MAG: hypothetical protein HPY66_0640 [Firmicutes bacterium]|nr:hypothetical protein [Bacillota bacterium]